MLNSKVMVSSDYQQLNGEPFEIVDRAIQAMGGWLLEQHVHRHWEYQMLMDAIINWKDEYANKFGGHAPYRVADVGGAIGVTTPLMITLGWDVVMYEPWVYGDQTQRFWEINNNVAGYMDNLSHEAKKLDRDPGLANWIAPNVGLRNTPLCELSVNDKFEYDIAACISTLEHIGEYEKAFFDLLTMVKKGGLVFLTTDFGEHEEDNYINANLRAGRMFCETTYNRLIEIGESCGFETLQGSADYQWNEHCKLVNDHGFASLALVRRHNAREHKS